MAAPALDMLARFAAIGLLNSLVLGTAIAAAAWAFLRLSGNQQSRTRFVVWFSALLLAAILPWIGAPACKPTSGLGHSTGAGITLPAWCAAAIFWLWAAGAGVALLRVGFAFWQLFRLRWHCRVMPPPLRRAQAGLSAASVFSSSAGCGKPNMGASPFGFAPGSCAPHISALNKVRAVGICVSDQVRIPTAVGLFQPLVVIPSWALEELSADELNSVLIHELEHLRRWDDWTNLAQKILAALFFFHPAVWWMDRKLALEREMACDEAVLAQTRDRQGYAACLVRVAEKSLLRRGIALAQAVVGRVSQTALRVTQILGDGHSAKSTWKPAVYLLTGGSVCAALLLAQVPPLVGFQSELPSAASSTSATTSPRLTATRGPAVSRPQAVLFREPDRRKPVRRQQTRQLKSDYAISASTDGQRAFIQPPKGFVQSLATAEATSPHAFLVVVQGGRFGQFGPAFWTICVWQVDAPGWHPLIPETSTPAKTI